MKRTKILMIDDDNSTMKPLKQSLEDFLDYKVEWEKAADEALMRLTSEEFDVIILDIMMPPPSGWSAEEIEKSNKGMSTGIILLDKIRAIAPKIPILIFTATRTEIKQNNNLLILRKPEATDVIDEKIKELTRI